MDAGLTKNTASSWRVWSSSKKIGARLRGTLALAIAHKLEVMPRNISCASKSKPVAN
jgi:hypothetical protein